VPRLASSPRAAAPLALAALLPLPLAAQERFDCIGADHGWTLEVGPGAALLEHGARIYEAEARDAAAQGFPLRLVLRASAGGSNGGSNGETAEVEIARAGCGEFDFTATVLLTGALPGTSDTDTAAPMRGCCRAGE
jgi:hypothetical protein